MKIFLSVGHSLLRNGSYTSANGTKYGGCIEYIYCKSLGGYVRDYLTSVGHSVDFIVCPEKKFTSKSEEYSYKITKENKGKYDLVVELHLNASVKHDAVGSEVYYYDDGDGKKTAKRVVEKLGTLFKNRGAKQNKSFYMLSDTVATAILIESFFCDNKSDYEKGKDVRKVAKLISEGIHGKAIATTPNKSEVSSGSEGVKYTVQTGAFTNKENAEKMKKELEKKGIDSIVKEVS